MRFKPLLGAAFAVLIFNIAFSVLVHNVLLKGVYDAAPEFFRPAEELNSKIVLMFLGWIISSLVFCLIVADGREGLTVAEGARIGLWIGLFMVAAHLSLYAILPMPSSVAVSWVLTDVVATIGSGVIFAAVFRRLKAVPGTPA
ncbi:hypothetical protein [Micromonospora sp. NBC_01412]|uniref:hypothetical protein n=1 Tax=Micromonospora sp. NBC_01412 TaxID=2903590 RepID=UPI003246AA7F